MTVTTLTSTCGTYRARIVADPDPLEPDWDDPSPEEMQCWADGEVYGIIIERFTEWVRYIADSPGEIETKHDWEEVDACWGFYGWEHAESSAKEMLDYAKEGQ